MKINVSLLTNTPIYAQIVEQIKIYILNGKLTEHSPLPSIRSLAKDLEVGVITVKKAYEVLTNEKLIYSKSGIGYFVNTINYDELNFIKKEEISKKIRLVIANAKNNGLKKDEISEIFYNLLKEMY